MILLASPFSQSCYLLGVQGLASFTQCSFVILRAQITACFCLKSSDRLPSAHLSLDVLATVLPLAKGPPFL